MHCSVLNCVKEIVCAIGNGFVIYHFALGPTLCASSRCDAIQHAIGHIFDMTWITSSPFDLPVQSRNS